jgi:hypothetical protein
MDKKLEKSFQKALSAIASRKPSKAIGKNPRTLGKKRISDSINIIQLQEMLGVTSWDDIEENITSNVINPALKGGAFERRAT